MRDEILENLQRRERELNESLTLVREAIRQRKSSNAKHATYTEPTPAESGGFAARRFASYNGRLKFQAIKELLAEIPPPTEDELADLMVASGVPLGLVRPRSNALKSIREYVKHGRLKERTGKLYLAKQ